jgi:hypothetical protein
LEIRYDRGEKRQWALSAQSVTMAIQGAFNPDRDYNLTETSSQRYKSPLHRAFNALFLIGMYVTILGFPLYACVYYMMDYHGGFDSAQSEAPIVCKWSFPNRCEPTTGCRFDLVRGCTPK